MSQGRKTLFSALALAALSPVAAEAQTDQPVTSAQSDDIVVVANKLGRNLDRAPVSATALDDKELRRLDVQSVRDAQVRIPSLVYNDSGGSAQAYIRGIGTNSAYAGLESSIGTYVDGVYLQRQVGASLDIVDLRDIQVLNGPQGSLYGRNATGGVILITTNDPVRELGGSVRAELGSYGKRGGEAILNLPISDALAFRVAGSYGHLDGFTHNISNGDRLSGYDRGTVRGKLKWDGPGGLTIVATAEYHDEKDDPIARRLLVGAPLCVACAVFGTAPPPANAFYQVSQDRTRKTDIRSTAGTLNISYRGDNFDVVSVTGVRDFHYRIFVDQDFASGDLFNSRAEEFGTTITSDNYVRTRFDGPFNFLAGVSGEHDTDSLLIQVFGAAFGAYQGAGGVSRVTLNSISPYGELYYNLTDRLKLTVGGRYNIDRKQLRAANDAAAGVVLGATPFVQQEKTYRGFTPRAVLSYETDLATVYASYSKGEKSGGFNTPAFTPLAPLSPEKLTSYEAGIKAKSADGRLRVSGAGFLYDYKDIQVSFVDAATGGVRAENAASARIYGAELNVSVKLLKGLQLSGGGLLEHARFTSYPQAAIFCPKGSASPGFSGCPAPIAGGLGFVNGVANLGGTRLPRAPELSYFLSAEYSFPIAGAWTGTLLVNDRYTGSYDFAPAAGGPIGAGHQSAYHLLSASISLVQGAKGFDLRAFADNLTNAKYFDEAPTSAFAAAGTAAAPRTYGMSLGYSF